MPGSAQIALIKDSESAARKCLSQGILTAENAFAGNVLKFKEIYIPVLFIILLKKCLTKRGTADNIFNVRARKQHLRRAAASTRRGIEAVITRRS